MPIIQSFAGISSLGFGVFPGGALESIATVTVGSGGASNIEFTSISGSYQHLQIRLISKVNAAGTGGTVTMRLNGDTGSNYARHVLYGDGSSAAASATASTTAMWAGTTNGTSATSVFGASIIDILDYANTSKNTTIRCLTGVDVNGSGGYLQVFSGLWVNTAAVTSILLTGFGDQLQHSTAALYGVRA